MKKRLTITAMFNDELTGYKDKMSSISMEIDSDDCSCIGYKKCITCKLIARGVLTDIEEKL